MKHHLLLPILLMAALVGCQKPAPKKVAAPLPENVQLAGAHNALVRLTPSANYVLLPVQESAPEDYVRVIRNNREAENFTIRLAVDSIDYFMPYIVSEEMKQQGGQLLFDVRLGDALECDRDACICWHAIQLADEFDTTNREVLWRPAFHHTPLVGWMNDPNGMFYDAEEGLWHLYFQYNPYGSMWHNMTWGHSVSTDLIHWTQVVHAIRPDAHGMIFSGSCVQDLTGSAGLGDSAVVALYTSARDAQSQSMAYSTDGGFTFTPYEANPVLTDSIPDSRDPKVFRNEQLACWTMVLACGQEVQFFHSADLIHWTFASRFGKKYGNHDGVWECPDLIELPVQSAEGKSLWVLLLNINPGGPFGGSATQYFVGEWDGNTFTCLDDPKEEKWLDYGKDHYAAVTFHRAPDHRAVALAWVSNWQYANVLPTKQYRSQNSFPRDLSLFVDDQGEYRVASALSPEVATIRGEQIPQPAEACFIDVEVPAGNAEAVITLSNDKGEQLVLNCHPGKGTISMDRRHSGLTAFSEDFPVVTKAPLFVKEDIYRFTICIDHCMVEAIGENGRWAMTNLVFPTAPYNHISLKGAEATIYEMK